MTTQRPHEGMRIMFGHLLLDGERTGVITKVINGLFPISVPWPWTFRGKTARKIHQARK